MPPFCTDSAFCTYPGKRCKYGEERFLSEILCWCSCWCSCSCSCSCSSCVCFKNGSCFMLIQLSDLCPVRWWPGVILSSLIAVMEGKGFGRLLRCTLQACSACKTGSPAFAYRFSLIPSPLFFPHFYYGLSLNEELLELQACVEVGVWAWIINISWMWRRHQSPVTSHQCTTTPRRGLPVAHMHRWEINGIAGIAWHGIDKY